MKRSRAGIRYAKAIYSLALERGEVDRVTEDFATIRVAIENSRDLENLLNTPTVDVGVKQRILTMIFDGKIDTLTMQFVALLTRKGRAADLPAVAESYHTLLDEANNVTPATVTTAVDLPDEQRQRITQRLGQLSGSNIRAEFRVDQSIVGGFQALFGDRLIDASVRHQLRKLHESLAEGSS